MSNPAHAEAALTEISRTRALTDHESRLLEQAIKSQEKNVRGGPYLHRPWSETEEDLVAVWEKRGKGAVEIAGLIGRTPVAVDIRIKKMRREGRL